MKLSKLIAYILIVFVFYSCNSTKKDAIIQLETDLLIIKESQLELVEHYDKCLLALGHQSEAADGFKRIFCSLSLGESEQLKELNLIKTKRLVDLGYKVSIDAKNHHRIFYQFDTKEYAAGIIKYGLLYSSITHIQDSVYSLEFDKIDTLKQIDIFNKIIEVNEYAE